MSERLGSGARGRGEGGNHSGLSHTITRPERLKHNDKMLIVWWKPALSAMETS